MIKQLIEERGVVLFDLADNAALVFDGVAPADEGLHRVWYWEFAFSDPVDFAVLLYLLVDQVDTDCFGWICTHDSFVGWGWPAESMQSYNERAKISVSSLL